MLPAVESFMVKCGSVPDECVSRLRDVGVVQEKLSEEDDDDEEDVSIIRVCDSVIRLLIVPLLLVRLDLGEMCGEVCDFVMSPSSPIGAV